MWYTTAYRPRRKSREPRRVRWGYYWEVEKEITVRKINVELTVSDVLEQMLQLNRGLSDEMYSRIVCQTLEQNFHDPRLGPLLSLQPAPASTKGEEQHHVTGSGVLSEDLKVLERRTGRGVSLQIQHLFPKAQPGDEVMFDILVGYTIFQRRQETGQEPTAEETEALLSSMEGAVNPALLARWKRKLEEG